ncbi:MAG TPA: hypothetical protein VGG28_26940 [Kofleriaceae bacterium]
MPELAARPLGAASVDAFAWRKRDGQRAFHVAQLAETDGNWAGVVAACKTALAADPTHLDAAWLLAIGYAKLHSLEAITAPLAQAVAGDFGKWAAPSLEHPALGEFLATAAGAAWRRRVTADRAIYTSALARSIIVDAAGELYAYEPTAPRWYRLTHTNGRVLASFVSGHRIAYATRSNGRVSVGAIDLETGVSTHAVPMTRAGGPAAIVSTPTGMWVSQGPIAKQLALDGKVTTASATRPDGPMLQISARGHARVVRLPIAQITGDWDDRGTASAIRIGSTGRVVSIASPGVIAGNTIAWSPDRSRIAFVAQLVDTCTPGAPTVGAFIADAATGTTHELARGNAIAIAWVNDRQLAIADSKGVALADGTRSTPIAGATALAEPSFRARCEADPLIVDPAGSDDEDPAQ